MASSSSIRPSSPNRRRRRDAAIMIGTSRRQICRWMASGAIAAQSPRMKSTLKTFDPTTFATAIAFSPRSTA